MSPSARDRTTGTNRSGGAHWQMPPGIRLGFPASLRLLLKEFQSLDVHACAVRTWKSGHYFYVPSLAGLLVRNAWLDGGYMCLCSSRRLLDDFAVFFYMLEWTWIL